MKLKITEPRSLVKVAHDKAGHMRHDEGGTRPYTNGSGTVESRRTERKKSHPEHGMS